MKSIVHITLATGHVFELPLAAIAANRAAVMLELHKDEFSDMEAAMGDTVELFNDDLWNAKDWACNNMNWSDLEPHARLVRFTPPKIDIHEGEWTYHDHPALVGELDAETILQSPVEFVVTTMAASKQLCNVTVLNAQDGKPFGLIALMYGTPEVISTYLSGLQTIGNALTATDPIPATH